METEQVLVELDNPDNLEVLELELVDWVDNHKVESELDNPDNLEDTEEHAVLAEPQELQEPDMEPVLVVEQVLEHD